MLYKYEATTLEGERQSGVIEAATLEIAINSLQRRNLIIISINPTEKSSFFSKSIGAFERVKARDVVFLSRQLSTLFEAQVPVLDSFKLLAAETENPLLRRKLSHITEDVQGGIPMSQAMAKHPDIFSRFYVTMVRSGEESGKLQEVFLDLANHLERSYELTTKARNALIYPGFVIMVFITVVILMITFVLPRLRSILSEAGQDIPLFTKVILGISDFLRAFGPFIFIGMIIGLVVLWRYTKTSSGSTILSRFLLSFPYVGMLFKKMYLSRMTENLRILLSSGISMVRSLEITADVVGNKIYGKILNECTEAVKGGSSLSEVFAKYEDIPLIVSKMTKIGEEAGKLNFMLETLSRFYKREVDSSVENLVSIIEPVFIIILAVAVAILLLAVLGPIYNLASVL